MGSLTYSYRQVLCNLAINTLCESDAQMLLLITPGVFQLFKSARLVIATLYDLLMGQSTLDMLPLLFNCPPAAHLSRGDLKIYQTDFRSRNFQFPMRTGTHTMTMSSGVVKSLRENSWLRRLGQDSEERIRI